MKNHSTFKSVLSNIEFPIYERISGHAIQNPMLKLIKADHPDFSSDQYMAISELNFYREKYILNYLLTEIGELSHLEQHVIGSLKEDTSLVSQIEDVMERRAFGGSWIFICLFWCFYFAMTLSYYIYSS